MFSCQHSLHYGVLLLAALSNIVSGQQRVIRKWLGGALGSLLPSGALLAYDRTNSTSQLGAAAYYEVFKPSANFGNQHSNRAQGRFVLPNYIKIKYKLSRQMLLQPHLYQTYLESRSTTVNQPVDDIFAWIISLKH